MECNTNFVMLNMQLRRRNIRILQAIFSYTLDPGGPKHIHYLFITILKAVQTTHACYIHLCDS